MKEQGYSIERVKKELHSIRQQIAIESKAGQTRESQFGFGKLSPLQWNFDLPRGGFLNWRGRVKKLLRHLTAWQWIPLVEQINRQQADHNQWLSLLDKRSRESIAEYRQIRHSLELELEQLGKKNIFIDAVIERIEDQQKDLAQQFENKLKLLKQDLFAAEKALAENLDQLKGYLSSTGSQLDKKFEETSGQLQTQLKIVKESAEKTISSLAKRSDIFERELAQTTAGFKELNKNYQGEQLSFRVRRLEDQRSDNKAIARDLKLPAANRKEKTLLNIDYGLFSEKFRGSEQEVKKRQQFYLNFFKGAKAPIVDIGCGRGEFLQLLQENKIAAYGLEISEDFFRCCREKKLEVKKEEALKHLTKLKKNSLGGVFLSHIIEHFDYPTITSLLELARSRLINGGLLAIETANPLSLLGWHGYLLDPTHSQPLHPELLDHLLKVSGFSAVKLHFLNPVSDKEKLQAINCEIAELTKDSALKQLLNYQQQNIQRLNNFLFACQDYSLLARVEKND